MVPDHLNVTHGWIQTGRPFREMLLLCAGQAVCSFITDMSPDATDDQIKNELITDERSHNP